jgi:hypothetical protein
MEFYLILIILLFYNFNYGILILTDTTSYWDHFKQAYNNYNNNIFMNLKMQKIKILDHVFLKIIK